MGKSLYNQMRYAITECFEDGRGNSKHSDKCNGGTNGKIYSYSEKNNRLDVMKNFTNWMKENHNEVKLAKQVNGEHVREFLLSKSDKCSNATIEQYRAQLTGLGHNVNRVFKTNVNYGCERVSGNGHKAIRTNPMTRENFNKLRDSYRVGTSGYNALTVASAGGCRVSELAHMKNRDIRILNKDKAEIFVKDGKGGRDRTITVNGEDKIKELEELKRILGGEDTRLVGCNKDSLMKNLQRHMTEVGIKQDYTNQGFHSIRKMWAQEIYDEYREEHTLQESLDYTSEMLGHGKDRDLETLQRYIKNIH